jgi:hypothetical protein
MDFNLNDFNYEGFDGSTYAQLQQLTKALEANTGVTNIAGMTDFQSLQLQSMETTLAMLTATDKKLTLWRDIAKGGATSTIEEYAAQFGYGQDNGGWVQQSENPVEADAQFSREFSIVKFNRQMWKFSDVAGMVSVITPAEKAQKEAASMRCLRAYNSSLYSGNSAMVAEQIDGFAKVIENNGSVDHVVDFRGVTPTERAFSDAAELIILYCSPGGISTLNQLSVRALSVKSRSSERVGLTTWAARSFPLTLRSVRSFPRPTFSSLRNTKLVAFLRFRIPLTKRA